MAPLCVGTVVQEMMTALAAQLRSSKYLAQGDSLTNDLFTLTLQSDGSLVVTKSGTTEVIYTTDNNGIINGPYSLVMQDDGNLVTYGGGSTTYPAQRVFTSGSQGLDRPPYVFIMQNDGNAVVYGATAPIWSTANGINEALVG